MFGDEFEKKIESNYTQKIEVPTYEPKNKKPHVLELYDDAKTRSHIIESKGHYCPII
jgi:hypothetical protein